MRLMAMITAPLLLLLAATPGSIASGSAAPAAPAPMQLRAAIEAQRKGDLVVHVSEQGKPARAARVEIRQTRHAFLFGSNIFLLDPKDESPQQEAYQERFKALLNYATLPFYWGQYERERGKPSEARLRAMAEWCRTNQIEVKGHPVLWHEAFPSWLKADEPIEPLVAKRIAETVGGFKGLVDRWDIVNESIAAPEFKPENPWSLFVRKAGPLQVVDRALRQARDANPDGFFVVNDFKIVPEYEQELGELQKRGAPVRAIGIQSHMHGEEWTPGKTWTVCETYGRLGLPLHFTEVTVLSGPKEKPMTDYHTNRTGWNTTPEEEAKQADTVERFYELLFAHPAVEAITWWDLSDDRAWMRAPAGLVRGDMSPKPAYERLLKKVRGEWWTARADATTDAQGRAALRGFYGDYEATVTLTDGTAFTRPLTIRKGTTEPVELSR
jgi:GH35 family endo-1,4-beta-xylanase